MKGNNQPQLGKMSAFVNKDFNNLMMNWMDILNSTASRFSIAEATNPSGSHLIIIVLFEIYGKFYRIIVLNCIYNINRFKIETFTFTKE